MTETTLRTQEILDRVKTIQALSPGAAKLLDLMGQGTYEISDVVQVIETDSGLTVNVLKTVNSAAMGMRNEVTTIQRAVAFLGETKIIGIALAASAGEVLNADLTGYQGNRGDLGRHCLWTAIASRELAAHTDGKVEPGVAFTSGLLHDIGKAVISDFLAENPDNLARLRSELGKCSQLDLERQSIGTDHCAVGHALATHWRMPPALISGIEFHHAPDKAPAEAQAMAYVVHTADMLSMMFGVGTGADDMQYELNPDYQDFISIDTAGIEGLALDVQIDFQATAAALFGDNQETDT